MGGIFKRTGCRQKLNCGTVTFSFEKAFIKNATLPFLIIEEMSFLLSEREASTEAIWEREKLKGSSGTSSASVGQL